MAEQIKTNEAGFSAASSTLAEYIREWELQNNAFFRGLNELGEVWSGASSHAYTQGSDCVYACSIQKLRDLKQLRSDSIQALQAITDEDVKHAKSIETNYGGE